jgi:hypothetical protein
VGEDIKKDIFKTDIKNGDWEIIFSTWDES